MKNDKVHDLQSVHTETSSAEDDAAIAEFTGRKNELKREWGFWSLLGFSTLTLSTWQATGTLIGPAFTNGGPIGIIYGFLASAFGVLCIYLSLAEMASIIPIAGAQYYWTAMFSPPGSRLFLSYVQGWLTLSAWEFAIAAVAYLQGSIIIGLVVFNYPGYEPKGWHTCLVMIAIIIISAVFVIVFKYQMPVIETMYCIFYVILFFVIMITLLALSEKASNKYVWETFVNSGGWSNDGVSFCLGFLGPTLALAGGDCCVHMAEECRNPAVNVPRGMIGSLVLNCILAFAYLVVLLYSINDIDAVLTTPTGYPMIEIFYQGTGSRAAATVFTALIVVGFFFGILAALAGTARLVWSFSRDHGIPFSSYFYHIDRRTSAPIRGLYLTCTITILLSLIVIGSSIAFNALISLATLGFYFSYCLPICAMLYHRIANASTVRYGPWKLGAFGIPVNVLAIAFSVFLIVFLPFPVVVPVTGATMNYSGPILLAVLAATMVDWSVRGKKKFRGPAVAMALKGMGGEAEKLAREAREEMSR